jgi:dienelactone hydrolase
MLFRQALCFAATILFFCMPLLADAIVYNDGDVVLEGYITGESPGAEPRPGVLIFPDWMGVHDGMKQAADAVAKLGYVAMVADMYGKESQPNNTDEARTLTSGFYKDRSLFRKRAAIALAELARRKSVVPGRVAAMGYCFGGTAALELARSGADILGVVSFHGGLSNPNPADARQIRGKVLAFHGAEDPLVPQEEVLAFTKEMREAKIDWQLVIYGNAVHGFTARNIPMKEGSPVGYNEDADRRSWAAMRAFYEEIFSRAAADH